MRGLKHLVAASAIALSATTTVQAQSAAVDPQVTQALSDMGTYLRSLVSFTIQADDTLDEVLEATGQKVQFSKTTVMHVRRPNRLRADIETEGKTRRMYYDGQTFTLSAPTLDYYATVPAPTNIGDLIDKVESKFGISFPLVDLFKWGLDEDDISNIKSAMLVGPAKFRGQLTDHYALRQEGIDWQVWIARGLAPLPVKYVVTTTDEESHPQFTVNLKWNTNVNLADSLFKFSPDANDHQIEIVRLGEAKGSN